MKICYNAEGVITPFVNCDNQQKKEAKLGKIIAATILFMQKNKK